MTAFRSSLVRRAGALTVLCALASSVVSAVDKDKAMYVGGTVSRLEEKAEGLVSTDSDTEFRFNAGGKGSVTIPYEAITSLEYGQKAGRRVAVGILISPLALFSKKRKHFLTVTFNDEAGKEQAAIFELGKDIVRTTLKVFEVRSGKKVEPQDVEACKQFKTPKECEASK